MRAKSLRDTRVSSSHLTGYHHSLRMIASLSTCSCNTTTPAPAPAPVRHAFTRRSLRPVNPLKELHDLAGLFPEPADAPLFLNARHVAREATPEPYRTMLVHEHHMTISMESWHHCSVDVEVLESRFQDGLYLRKIRLLKSGTSRVVQFGYVRFNLELVTEPVRREILEERVPLGRILIQHNVFRHVELGAILQFTAGPGLAHYLQMPAEADTWGRLATIFCNGSPAIDLLEITAPLE